MDTGVQYVVLVLVHVFVFSGANCSRAITVFIKYSKYWDDTPFNGYPKLVN